MRSLSGHSRLFAVAALVVGLASYLSPSTVEASILLPDDSVNMKQILAQVGKENSSSSSKGTCDVPSPPDNQCDEESDDNQGNHLTQFFTPNTSGGNSSSSGTSSTGGANGPGSFAISSTALAISDAHAIGWALSERRLALPMPHENGLLRPPQSV